MSEKKLVIDQLKLTFEGIFDLNGLYRTIDSWFYEKNYDKWEKKNYEQVMPTGKDIEIEMLPWKKTTDYFKNIIKIRMRFTNIKDVEIEKQGVKLRLNQGKVMMIFDGYLESDYDQKWEDKPMFFLLRTLFDKYVFRSYFTKFEKWLVNDVYDIHGRIQRFLNLYRYDKHV
ncbi:hypothetical protein KY343_03265 [Candidatus Woesearchaeota archaeon]|nr:hypothetical protein [Candidatus Woesearchaeota archaeon]